MWKYELFVPTRLGPPWHDQILLPLCPPIYIACHTIFSPGICLNLVCRVGWWKVGVGFLFSGIPTGDQQRGILSSQIPWGIVNLGFVLWCDKFMLFLESWCIELDSILFRITGKREKHGMQYHIRGMPLLSWFCCWGYIIFWWGREKEEKKRREEKKRKDERWKMLWLTFPIILDHLNEWLQHPMPWRSHRSLLRRQRCQVSPPSTNSKHLPMFKVHGMNIQSTLGIKIQFVIATGVQKA